MLSQWFKDWAPVIPGIAGAITAIVALVTVFATNKSRSLERKSTLRNEILRWAIEINVFAIKNRTEAIIPYLTPTKCGEFINAHIYERLFDTLEPYRSWEVYAEHISKTLGSPSHDGVINLRDALRRQIRLLHTIRRKEHRPDFKYDPQKLALAIARNNSHIHSVAIKLIDVLGRG